MSTKIALPGTSYGTGDGSAAHNKAGDVQPALRPGLAKLQGARELPELAVKVADKPQAWMPFGPSGPKVTREYDVVHMRTFYVAVWPDGSRQSEWFTSEMLNDKDWIADPVEVWLSQVQEKWLEAKKAERAENFALYRKSLIRGITGIS